MRRTAAPKSARRRPAKGPLRDLVEGGCLRGWWWWEITRRETGELKDAGAGQRRWKSHGVDIFEIDEKIRQR